MGTFISPIYRSLLTAILLALIAGSCGAHAGNPRSSATFEIGSQDMRMEVLLDITVIAEPKASNFKIEDFRRWCHWTQGLVLQAQPGARLNACHSNAETAGAPTADYQITLTLGGKANPNSPTQLTITNPRPQGGLPIPPLHWVLSPESDQNDESRRIALQVAFNSFFSIQKRERTTKEILLARGVHESNQVRLSESGWYEDTRTGEQLSFDSAFERYLEESSQNKKWVQATLQIAAVLGVGAVWYNWDKSFNSQDWEYTFDWDGVRKKIHHGVRFDTNTIRTNSPLHPLAGSFYYAFSRGNGLGARDALLMSFAGSALWELVVEYREVFSINDMIFTPVAGAAIGEAMHQIRLLFERATGTPGQKLLLALFGGPSAVDSWLTRNGAPRAKKVDRRGLPSDIQHTASLYLGGSDWERSSEVSNISSTGSRLEGKVSSTITSVPGYTRPGEKNVFYWDTIQSQLQVEFGFTPEQLDQFRFFVEAAWFGYHQQSIQKDSNNRLSGYSFLIGPATSYSHSIRRLSDGTLDEIGIVNVLGASLELIVFARGLKVSLRLQAAGDFAAVHSLAVSRYRESVNPRVSTKKLLEQQDYYFAFGVTWRGQISAEYEFLELGLSHSSDLLYSLEGLDRYQSQVVDDYPLQDESHFTKAWLGAKLPIERLKLIVSYSQIRRLGWLNSHLGGEFNASHLEHAGSIGLEYEY